MSLHPHQPDPIPEGTARIARAACPGGNPSIRMRDELDAIYQDEQFRTLFPSPGKPAAPPWRLALVTIFPFAEDLSDRQAADAVRARIDGKYALSLELTDPGFDHTVLGEFRSRLLEGGADHLLLDVLLERFRALGLVRAGGAQRRGTRGAGRDACAGRCPGAQPTGTGSRNDAARAQRVGRCCFCLAPCSCPA